MVQSKPRAYVVPAAAANGYGAIRSLAREGVKVLALDHARYPVRHSRLCDFQVVPDPDGNEEAFVAALLALASREAAPPYVAPTQDLHVHVLHKYAAQLAPWIRFPFMGATGVAASIDKSLMVREAGACGLNTPETRQPRTPEELESLLPKLNRYPYLIKPLAKFDVETARAYRNFAFYHYFGAKALRADDPGALTALFAQTHRLGFKTIVQEEIQGPAGNLVAVDFYADADHNITAWHTGRKLRQWPPDYGTCTRGQSTVIPRLLDLARRFTQRTGFRGVGNIEFKLRGGTPYFLEVNPRPWMWIWMATQAGVNLPYAAYRDAVGSVPVRAHQSKEADWIDLRMDVRHLRQRPWTEWIRTVGHLRNDARFSIRDPLLPAGSLLEAVRRRLPHAEGSGRSDRGVAPILETEART